MIDAVASGPGTTKWIPRLRRQIPVMTLQAPRSLRLWLDVEDFEYRVQVGRALQQARFAVERSSMNPP